MTAESVEDPPRHPAPAINHDPLDELVNEIAHLKERVKALEDALNGQT